MKRVLYIGILLIVLGAQQACKTTQLAQTTSADRGMSSKKIIKNHYKNQLHFTTLRGKMVVEYKDGTEDQAHTLSWRMEKDKTIWISAPFGMVKALITPEKVKFYNRLDQTYFDGDFAYLSKMLGTELDFQKVQSLLLGHAIFDLEKERYQLSVIDDSYLLRPKKEWKLFERLFAIEPKNFRMQLQQISQDQQQRMLAIKYPNYQVVADRILPENIAIEVVEKNNKKHIGLQYKGLRFDEKLRFPFKIPSGYKQIEL